MEKPRWFDCDAHIIEQKEVWERVDKPFRDRIKLTYRTDDPFYRERLYDVALDGNPIPAWRGEDRQKRWEVLIPRVRAKYKEGAGMLPEQYLRDLDTEGLARVVVYPTLFLFAAWMPQLGAAFSSALARAYNDYIYDFCSHDKSRMHPVVTVALHDVGEAIREVKRNAERGFVGVFVRPNPLYGRTLGHPDYTPLYEVCQDLRMPIGIHEGTHGYITTLGLDRTNTQAGHHIMSHPFEQMAAMTSLVENDVFERFPKLNFLFLEAGTLWAAYWVRRLDAERKQYRSRSGGALPSEYFNRQCFISTEVDDDCLAQSVELLGDNRIMMSTDYPHDESLYPNSARLWAEQKISPESLLKIGWSNTFEAYPRLAR